MRALRLFFVAVIAMSANSYGSVLTSDGYKCLSEAEELALKEACSKSDESSLVCDSASGWYFDSGRLRRAECDLAIENKRLELAFDAVRKAVEKLDQDEVSEDGGYPAGHPIKMILDDAQEAWLAYVSLHCKELAGPRGAGLAWHADEIECRLSFVRQRADYLLQHWSLNVPR